MEDNDWEVHKAEIERLYVRRDRPLKDVMEILRKRRSFYKTYYSIGMIPRSVALISNRKKQYENAFKAWGFRKYKMTPTKWKLISRRIQKRKRESGKESAVYIDGELYPRWKLQAGLSRHGFVSTAEIYSVPSPDLPEGILVCSPLPASVAQWPLSLPWFQFLNRLNRQESGITPTILSSAISPRDRHEHPLATRRMTQNLEAFSPYYSQQGTSSMQGGDRLHNILRMLVPEAQDGEHQITSDVLYGHIDDRGLQERFKLLFYLLSNNLNLNKRERDKGDIRHSGDRKREDELILNILRNSGLDTIENMKHLLAIPGLTARVIAERLFQSAVRSSDMDIMGIMLNVGMDPNTLIPTEDDRALSSLEYCCRSSSSIDMINLFLSHHADVNQYQSQPVLVSAILSRNKSLIRALLSRGADTVACLERLEIMAEGEGPHSDLLDALKWLLENYPPHELTIGGHMIILKKMLRIAVRAGDIQFLEMLRVRGVDVNSLHKMIFGSSTVETTALGLAAERGNMRMLQALYKLRATVNPTSIESDNIAHPLTLAVARRHYDATVFLINCGADINASDYFCQTRKTVFDRALQQGDLKICRLLLDAGAMTGHVALQSFHDKCLYEHTGKSNVNSLLKLPFQQVDLDATSSGRDDAALGKALLRGSPSMVKTLDDYGATKVEKRLNMSAEVENAEHLASVGLLRRDMNSSGHDVLANAILHGGGSLIDYLLQSNAEHIAEITKDSFEGKYTALEAAIQKANLTALESLLTHGAHITDRDLTGAVKKVLQTGDDLFLGLFLCLRSPLNLRAPNALRLAVSAGNRASLNLLLASGIDPKGVTSGESILQYAAVRGDNEIFHAILMSTEWSKEELGRAFTLTVWSGHIARMRHLHDCGAHLNQDVVEMNAHWTPLRIAVERQDVSLVKTLLDYGCDPSKYVDEGDTPLEGAAKNGNIEIVNLLLEAGADLDRTPVGRRRTPLQIAVLVGNIELVERLLDAGADVNSEPGPNGGGTALQFAAIQGFIGIALRLLQEGADVNAERAPSFGRTALEGAAEHGRVDMLHLLLDHGALIEGHGRRQYVRAVKLAELNAHSALANFLRLHGHWTSSDSLRYDLEEYNLKRYDFGVFEPRRYLPDPNAHEYEDDPEWDYSVR